MIMYGLRSQASRSAYTRPLTALLLTLATAGAASVQQVPDSGGRVFGLFGGSFGDGDSTVMTSAGAGLRITRQLGIDFEVLYVPDLNLPTHVGVVPLLQGRRAFFQPKRDASLTAFLTKLTVEFPTAGDRLFPYVTGGGGIGRLSQRIRFASGAAGNRPPAIDVLRPIIFPLPDIEFSETDLSLTIGGGVDVRVWRGLGVGVDVRYLRLLGGREDLDFAHVASRVSYRF